MAETLVTIGMVAVVAGAFYALDMYILKPSQKHRTGRQRHPEHYATRGQPNPDHRYERSR